MDNRHENSLNDPNFVLSIKESIEELYRRLQTQTTDRNYRLQQDGNHYLVEVFDATQINSRYYYINKSKKNVLGRGSFGTVYKAQQVFFDNNSLLIVHQNHDNHLQSQQQITDQQLRIAHLRKEQEQFKHAFVAKFIQNAHYRNAEYIKQRSFLQTETPIQLDEITILLSRQIPGVTLSKAIGFDLVISKPTPSEMSPQTIYLYQSMEGKIYFRYILDMTTRELSVANDNDIKTLNKILDDYKITQRLDDKDIKAIYAITGKKGLHPKLTFIEGLLVFRELLLALNFMHHDRTRRVAMAHLDLKPANIMANLHRSETTGQLLQANIALLDYDFSIKISHKLSDDHSQIPLNEVQGSPYYIAPEVIRDHSAGIKSDIRTLVAILIEILHGYPFISKDKNYQPTRANDPPTLKFYEIPYDLSVLNTCFPDYYPKELKTELSDFLKKMQAITYDNRPTSDKVLKFFCTFYNRCKDIEDVYEMSPIHTAMKVINAVNKGIKIYLKEFEKINNSKHFQGNNLYIAKLLDYQENAVAVKLKNLLDNDHPTSYNKLCAIHQILYCRYPVLNKKLNDQIKNINHLFTQSDPVLKNIHDLIKTLEPSHSPKQDMR